MRIALVGDVMLGRIVNEVLARQSPAYVWGSALDVLRQADLRVCNLECVIASDGRPWTRTPKAFHFRSDACNIAVLRSAGIGMVSLANNHVLDFEYAALLEMIDLLDAAAIRHAGAGSDAQQARLPAIVELPEPRGGPDAGAGQRTWRVGMLAFADHPAEWEARPGWPGIWYVPLQADDPRWQLLLEQVQQTRDTVDFLIVSAHWGPNWGIRPLPEQVQLAHALIDQGADLVYGHSCHVVQGIEVYRQRPILYGTGDFVDDYWVDPDERNDRSFIFIAQLSPAPADDSAAGPHVDRAAPPVPPAAPGAAPAPSGDATPAPAPRASPGQGAEPHPVRVPLRPRLAVDRLLLIPTVIADCQARLAGGPEREAILERMRGLCRDLGTDARLADDPRRLEIVVRA